METQLPHAAAGEPGVRRSARSPVAARARQSVEASGSPGLPARPRVADRPSGKRARSSGPSEPQGRLQARRVDEDGLANDDGAQSSASSRGAQAAPAAAAVGVLPALQQQQQQQQQEDPRAATVAVALPIFKQECPDFSEHELEAALLQKWLPDLAIRECAAACCTLMRCRQPKWLWAQCHRTVTSVLANNSDNPHVYWQVLCSRSTALTCSSC